MSLSPTRQAVLDFIRKRIEATGYCPSQTEIANEISAAHQTVANSISYLCKLKLLVRVAPHVYGVPDLPMPEKRPVRMFGVEERPQPRDRNCLRCGDEFTAPTPWVRVCPPCKQIEEWKYATTAHATPGLRRA